jgi:hypothetical protein
MEFMDSRSIQTVRMLRTTQQVRLLLPQICAFSETALGLSFSDNMNCTNNALYSPELEDPRDAYQYLDGLEISDLAWLDDMFPPGKESSLPVPFQEKPFSIQSETEPPTGHPTPLSMVNEFSRTHKFESERSEETGKESFTDSDLSDLSRGAPGIESPVQIQTDQKPRKTGRRTGPLSPEKAKKVASIRRSKACWFCWLSKIPVSKENFAGNKTHSLI